MPLSSEEVFENLSTLGNIKFVYPENYDKLVHYVAALGAKKYDQPDFIVVEKLEDFVCVESRSESHRRFTKFCALLSSFCSGSTDEPCISCKYQTDGIKAIVSFSPKRSCEFSVAEVEKVGLWMNEVWLLSSSGANQTFQLSCRHGPLQNSFFDAKR